MKVGKYVLNKLFRHIPGCTVGSTCIGNLTHILSNRSSVPSPRCHSLPFGAEICGSGTTFSWLQDVLSHMCKA